LGSGGLGGCGLSVEMAPFFQEYHFEGLDAERDAAIILERTLEHGTRADVRWLLTHYGVPRVLAFVRDHGARHLSRRAFAFWRLVLALDSWRPHPWGEVVDAVWPSRG